MPTDSELAEQKRFKLQLIMSIVTLIVAPVFSFGVSFLVVEWQLTHQQTFATVQDKLARDRTRIDEKMRLQSQIAGLILKTASLRGVNAVEQLSAVYRAARLQPGESVDNVDVQRYFESLNELTTKLAELKGAMVMAHHFFGNDTLATLSEFEVYFSQHGLLPTSESAKILSDLGEKPPLDASEYVKVYSQELNKMNDTKWVEIGFTAVQKMTDEISHDLGASAK